MEAAPEKTTETPADKPAIWVPALKEAAVAFVLAAIVLIIVYAFAFTKIHPEFERFMGRGSNPITFLGSGFVPRVLGDGRQEGSSVVITEFLDGEAVLAINRRFQAEDYPFIKFNIDGLTTWAGANVFWKRADAPGELFQLPLNRSWSEVTQVAMPIGGAEYRGTITELAIGFFSDPTDHDNNGEPIILKDVELRPFSAARVAEQIFEDWTNPPLWQGYSNNIVRGIHRNGMLFPNAVANLLVVTGLAIAALRRVIAKRAKGRGDPRFQPRLLAVALCLCLYGWAFNDVLRWHWRVAQLSDTHVRYAGLPLEERIRNNPIRCGRRDDCFEHLLPYF
jgi:hypothetical protein